MQRQVDLCEFKASVVYTMSSGTARTTEKPCPQNLTNNNNNNLLDKLANEVQEISQKKKKTENKESKFK